ncbi:hypothetical protein [Desulfosporosinus metallidurans]|nr:hypothetical protein [Desulfosporosinus metallidurans]
MTCNIPNNNEYVEEALQRIKRNQQLIGVKIAVEYSCSKIGLSGKLQQGETLDDLYVLSEKLSVLSADELKRYELALEDGTARDVRSLIAFAASIKNAIPNMNSAPAMG